MPVLDALEGALEFRPTVTGWPGKAITIGRDGFALSGDLVTQTQAILARKRSGKSYTAAVEAEELLEAGEQIIAIDPTGAWWGLRASADGKGQGYAIPVFGGDHGDAPLDHKSGRAMARAIVDQGFSCILDVSNMRTEEQVEFVKELCSELLLRNRTPVHIFMDEADTFAPQKPLGKLQNECLGTVSRMVKQGGIRGLGFTMITQRPSSINKDVLSQVDLLTLLRMSSPHDLNPVEDWLRSETSAEFAREVRAALPSLPVGTAYIASAALDLAQKVEIRPRRTFNSGATPRPGEKRVTPELAPIDAQALGKEIAASVQRAQEESPEGLRRTIEELKAKLAGKGSADVAGLMDQIAELERENNELPALREAVAELPRIRERIGVLEQDLENAHVTTDRAIQFLEETSAQLARYREELLQGRTAKAAVRLERLPPESVGLDPAPKRRPVAVAPIAPPRESAGGKENLELRILRSLAEFAALGRTSISRDTLSAWAEARGGFYQNTLGRLRTAGLIDYPAAGMVALTVQGAKAAPKISAPPDARSFFERVVTQAGGGLPERVLRALRSAYPKPISRDGLSETVSARGGFYSNTLGSLRSAGFIDYPAKGEVRLADWTVLK